MALLKILYTEYDSDMTLEPENIIVIKVSALT